MAKTAITKTDRVAALDGTLSVESPVGAGTVMRVELPLRVSTRWLFHPGHL